MDIHVSGSSNRNNSPLRTQADNRSQTQTSRASSAEKNGKTDQVFISSDGRQSVDQNQGPFSKMETAVLDGDFAALVEAAREKAGNLEVNWDAVVDPGGQIAARAYVESLVTQYQKQEETIKAYYAKSHEENLTYDDPYGHVWQKYKTLSNHPDFVSGGSPYFRSDMSGQEREMAFRQECALLSGGSVTLNDPYALASSGGVLHAMDASKIAEQAVRAKLDQLILEQKEISKK